MKYNNEYSFNKIKYSVPKHQIPEGITLREGPERKEHSSFEKPKEVQGGCNLKSMWGEELEKRKAWNQLTPSNKWLAPIVP